MVHDNISVQFIVRGPAEGHLHHYSRPPSPSSHNYLVDQVIYRTQISTAIKPPNEDENKGLNINEEPSVDETPQFKTVQELVSMYGQSDQSHLYEEIAPGLTRLTIRFDGNCTPALIPNANNNINNTFASNVTNSGSSITKIIPSNESVASAKPPNSPKLPVGAKRPESPKLSLSAKNSRVINGVRIDTFHKEATNITVNGFTPSNKKPTDTYPPSLTDYMQSLSPNRRHHWCDDVNIKLEEKNSTPQKTVISVESNSKVQTDLPRIGRDTNIVRNENSEINSNSVGKYVSKVFIGNSAPKELHLSNTNDKKEITEIKDNLQKHSVPNTPTSPLNQHRPHSLLLNETDGKFTNTVLISNDTHTSSQDTRCASPDVNSNSSSPAPPPPPMPSSAAATPTGVPTVSIIPNVTPEDLQSVTLKRRMERSNEKFADTLPMKNKRNDALIAELKALNGDFQTLKRIQQEKKKMEIDKEHEKHLSVKKDITTEKFIDLIPDRDNQGNPIPPWKKQILAKQQAEKARQEAEERLRVEAEEQRIKSIPAWKRAVLEKREAEARAAREALAERQQREAEERAAAAAARGVKIEIEETGHPLAPWQTEEDGLV